MHKKIKYSDEQIEAEVIRERMSSSSFVAVSSSECAKPRMAA
jgi:hypothetical protein